MGLIASCIALPLVSLMDIIERTRGIVGLPWFWIHEHKRAAVSPAGFLSGGVT